MLVTVSLVLIIIYGQYENLSIFIIKVHRNNKLINTVLPLALLSVLCRDVHKLEQGVTCQKLRWKTNFAQVEQEYT